MSRVPPLDRAIRALPFFRHEPSQMAARQLRRFMSIRSRTKRLDRRPVNNAQLPSQRILRKRSSNRLPRLADTSRKKIPKSQDLVRAENLRSKSPADHDSKSC